VDNKPIEELIPNFFRSRNKIDEDRFFVVKKPKFPLVKNLSRPYMVSNGLSGKNIALWASHGLYFDQKLLRWEWQRARVMQTVEDLYTLSYVYPFLMPMLENAGATVLTPRERDTQCHEILVDNDIADSSEYHEFNQTEIWSIGKTAGFASSKNFYLQGENPFKMGSYRQISSVSNKKKISFAEWKPNIPETGKYAFTFLTILWKTVLQKHITRFIIKAEKLNFPLIKLWVAVHGFIWVSFIFIRVRMTMGRLF
jgi:hypothetical protein